MENQYDLSNVGLLTHQKTKHVIERDGFAVTGFVLAHPDGRKCLVDMSAVRWFHDKDGRAFFRLMHPDNLPANAKAPGSPGLSPSPLGLPSSEEQG